MTFWIAGGKPTAGFTKDRHERGRLVTQAMKQILRDRSTELQYLHYSAVDHHADAMASRYAV